MRSSVKSPPFWLAFLATVLLLALAVALPPMATAQSATPTKAATPKATKTPKPTATPLNPTQPGFTESKCPFQAPPGIPSSISVTCGYLAVPLDRAAAKSPLISLAVAVFTNEDATEADPIVYLAGGPGENALESLYLAGQKLIFPAIAASRDLVMFDQRGVGFSQPTLDCPDLLTLGADALDRELGGVKVSDEEIGSRMMDAAAACRKALSAKTDLSKYTTDASAADVEDLRKALRYKQWNLWGVSYGTRLALEVMRDYPAGIRSVILDSVYPTDVDVLAEQPAAMGRALEALYAACAKDERCNTETPRLASLLEQTVAKLDKSPLKLRAFDLVSGKNYDVQMMGGDLIDLVALALGQMPEKAPALIKEVSEGKTTLAQQLVSTVLISAHYLSSGANYSFMCHDEVAFSSPAALEAALKKYPLVARRYTDDPSGAGAFDLCKLWNSGQGSLKDNAPVAATMPALVMAGQNDPITPPAWAQRTAKRLKAATYVELPGRAHGVSIDAGCGTHLMATFLNDPKGRLDTSCIKALPGLRWTPAEVKLLPFENEDMGISGVQPEGWVEVAPGTFSRARDGSDTTTLIVQALPWSRADLEDFLTENLGLKRIPAQVGTRETDAGLEWSLHRMPTSTGLIDLAVAETDDLTIHVIMEASKDEHEALYENVFLPAVDSVDLLK